MNSSSFNELKKYYNDTYSIGTFSDKFQDKVVLISLLCYVWYKARMEHPDVTFYKIIQMINKGQYIDDNIVCRLAIICEDFAYSCTEFPLFGVPKEQILVTIKQLLSKYLPF